MGNRGLIIAFFLLVPLSRICAKPVNVDKSSAAAGEIENQTCPNMINYLENEVAETEKSLKNCRDGESERTERESEKEKACEQTREKLELTKENLAEIKDVCDKGAVPGVLPKALTEKPSFKALLEELDIQAEKESPLPMGLRRIIRRKGH